MAGARRKDTGIAADSAVYQKPDPVKVARLLESHGTEAAEARWHWLSYDSIHHLASVGRQRLNAQAGIIVRTSRRKTTPEQEEAVIADVFALGGVSRASKKHGLLDSLVVTFLRERGIEDYPKVLGPERSALSHATRKARLALAAPVEAAPDVAPILPPVPPVPEAAPVMSMAAQNDDLRPERGVIPIDADVVRTDHERHGGCAQSMANEYGVSCTSVNRRLREIGLIKAKPSRSDTQPEVKPDWPAYEASRIEAVPGTSLSVTTPSASQAAGKKLRLGIPGIPGRPEPLQGIDRLCVADLAVAIELARTTGCEAALAVEFVRADRDASVLLQAGRF